MVENPKRTHRYSPDNQTLRRFSLADGIQANSQSNVIVLQTKSGEIWMSGLKGISVFTPDQIKSYEIPAITQITRIFIDSEEIESDTSVEEINRLVLPYQKNTISLEFCGM